MFTITHIKEAHTKVKSGTDFPKYLQELIKLGVKKYETFITDSHTEYEGIDAFTIKSDSKYASLTISNISDGEKFKHYLKIHQQGQTDYLTFCNHSAECGVEKWVVDTTAMTCIYYDTKGTEILAEKIPA